MYYHSSCHGCETLVSWLDILEMGWQHLLQSQEKRVKSGIELMWPQELGQPEVTIANGLLQGLVDPTNTHSIDRPSATEELINSQHYMERCFIEARLNFGLQKRGKSPAYKDQVSPTENICHRQ